MAAGSIFFIISTFTPLPTFIYSMYAMFPTDIRSTPTPTQPILNFSQVGVTSVVFISRIPFPVKPAIFPEISKLIKYKNLNNFMKIRIKNKALNFFHRVKSN